MATVRRKPVPSKQENGTVQQGRSLSHSDNLANKTPQSASNVTEQPCVSFCCHCRTPIGFDTQLFECGFCQVAICTRCHDNNSHSSSHADYVYELVVRANDPGHKVAAEQCSQCKESSESSFRCTECSDAWCRTCFDAQRNVRLKHGHRSFYIQARLIAGWNPTRHKEIGGDCTVHSRGVFTHCGLCYRSIGVTRQGAPGLPTSSGPSTWDCTTCDLSGPSICSDCIDYARCLHGPEHIFKKATLQFVKGTANAEDSDAVFQCDACDFKSQSSTSIYAHEHVAFSVFLFEKCFERWAAAFYRQCPLKAARVDYMPAGQNSAKCVRCSNVTPVSDLEYCMSCVPLNKWWQLCPTCLNQSGGLHRHAAENFVSFGSSTRLPAEDLPNCQARVSKRTRRMWFVPEGSLTGFGSFNAFERPTPLMDGWIWYVDHDQQSFFVHEQKGIAVRERFLSIPAQTWQQANPLLAPGWYREPSADRPDGFWHLATGVFMTACPVSHESLDLNPLPRGWTLIWHDKSDRPVFCPFYTSPTTYVRKDPRHVKSQWQARRLPEDWRVIEDDTGVCKFLPPGSARLVSVPPPVSAETLTPAEIPQGFSASHLDLPERPKATSTPTSPTSEPISPPTTPLTPLSETSSRTSFTSTPDTIPWDPSSRRRSSSYFSQLRFKRRSSSTASLASDLLHAQKTALRPAAERARTYSRELGRKAAHATAGITARDVVVLTLKAAKLGIDITNAVTGTNVDSSGCDADVLFPLSGDGGGGGGVDFGDVGAGDVGGSGVDAGDVGGDGGSDGGVPAADSGVPPADFEVPPPEMPMPMPPPPVFVPTMDWDPLQSAASDGVQVG